jgi:hypothetical protein
VADTGPTIDVAGLLEGVLASLFGATAQTSAPLLVDPVLGSVATSLEGLWPPLTQNAAPAQQGPPARVLTPQGLRRFLIGAGTASERMGKLAVLGLPVSALQAAWSADGNAIGDAAVQMVHDESTEPRGDSGALVPSTLFLTTSTVDALWRLNPFTESGDDPGSALAASFADVLAPALAGQAGTPEFQAAAAGRPLDELLTEARTYLAQTASGWLAMVNGLLRLRAGQQAGLATDDLARLEEIVTTYNDARAAQAMTPFTTYLAQVFLGDHPSTRPLPAADASVGGTHFTDVVRAAVRHFAAGSPVEEDGGGDHPPDAGPDPGDLGNAVLASAIALTAQVMMYTQDPAHRWDQDKADSSSFVQRALFGAGISQFDPGTDHGNVWSSRDFASRDEVFATVKPAAARPGDVLVQGGYKTSGADSGVVWAAHVGIFLRPSPAQADLLEGISMDLHGPTRQGLWGADPPRGYYAFGANLLVRRLKKDVLGASGPVVPAAAPVEGGLRIRIDTRGMAAVTSVRAGADQGLDLAQNAEGTLAYVTVPPGPAGRRDVVVTDVTEQSRTFPGALAYVEDAEKAARSVVASYEVAINESLDALTALASSGAGDDAARQQVAGALEHHLAAIDDGWFTRLQATEENAPGAAIDEIFQSASEQLMSLTERFWALLATN